MKNTIKISAATFILSLIFWGTSFAQDLQNFRPNGKTGLSIFETPKDNSTTFDGIKVRIGGAYALQFQAMDHENTANNLAELGSNFNLGTGNLDMNIQLADGLRMHMRTFLSSRHHVEAWVKDGYFQMDKLEFIAPGFLSEVMNYVTIKVGHMEINYGDLHFRRTDNGQALHNSFVGNYLMDSYSTEVAGEIYAQSNGLIGMIGLSNGRLNQSVTNLNTKAAVYGKVGYDSQVNEDVRVRITGSFYSVMGETNRTYLYAGDRAGSRYYKIFTLEEDGSSSDFAGRVNPGLNTKLTSFIINPFVKYQGLEFMGTYENASGQASADGENTRSWNQLGAELLYRFGTNENLYVAARYNTVSGELPGQTDKVSVNRLNIGGGWFLTENVLTKLEYVSQQYNDYPAGSTFEGAKFGGINIEAVVAF